MKATSKSIFELHLPSSSSISKIGRPTYWCSYFLDFFPFSSINHVTISSPQKFSANGQPYKVEHSDYLGGKGVGLVRLHTPAGVVDLYVSHLHGDYSRARGSGTTDR